MFFKKKQIDEREEYFQKVQKSISMAYSYISKYGFKSNLKNEPTPQNLKITEFNQLADIKITYLKLIAHYSKLIQLIHRHDVSLQAGILGLMTSYMNEEINRYSNMLIIFEVSNKHLQDDVKLNILNEHFQEAIIKLHWFSEKMTEIESEKLFYFKDEKKAIAEFINTIRT